MFCQNCGKQIEDDARFCPLCGERTEGASPDSSGKENESYSYGAERRSYGGQEPTSTRSSLDTRSGGSEAGSGDLGGQDKKYNIFCLLGFIASLVGLFWGWGAIVSIVLCVIGMSKIDERYERGKKLAFAGIIISISGFVLLLLVGFVGCGALTALIGAGLMDY